MPSNDNESYEPRDHKPAAYEPEVDDYVIWERMTGNNHIEIDKGWVYFKGDPIEPKKGFNECPRYITIETGVRDKPREQLEDGKCLHKKIHTLLLCYESQWHQLKFVKRRASNQCQHYSQYDDVNVD